MSADTGASPAEAMAAAFERRAADRELVIGVIGLGYVGLPLAEGFVGRGFRVLAYDPDAAKIDSIRAGRTYIRHISDERVSAMVGGGLLDATTDADRLAEADALLMCVPTPLNVHREPDLSYVEACARTIAERLRPGQLVVLESTTYPGTSEELIRPILEGSGLKAGIDFAIAYSPEREDPGNIQFGATSIPKVVGADTEAERRMACAVYAPLTTVVPVSDLKTAEAVKLTENIFRLVNIALVNELKVVFESMGIDIWEVVDAAKTKPFGYMPFYPGPGLGGHCIAIDPFYLTWKARAHGEQTRFIELAGDVVTAMPKRVVEHVAEALSTARAKAVNGARILVVGLAYKKNVDDMRESPSLHVIRMLRERGASVDYYDPHIPVAADTPEHPEAAGMVSIAWSPEALAAYDCAVICTDHDAVDYAALAAALPLVVDTRNATARLDGAFAEKIWKA
ncbi:MAG: nucleotide sugar dehydrogenase [Phenylobacterium sp.]|uniref:nucleotide sugar dehydrogenase n=1 Tax=Phenylobacterium sp. TaxID=1871053 RepID=UPI00391B7625